MNELMLLLSTIQKYQGQSRKLLEAVIDFLRLSMFHMFKLSRHLHYCLTPATTFLVFKY